MKFLFLSLCSKANSGYKEVFSAAAFDSICNTLSCIFAVVAMFLSRRLAISSSKKV